ncbi:galactokinase [Fusobacterium sp. PH5-44]|uniref:galactokinase n=1 Tax=unclassified Fusobacterium TaxID=2648384 RepID=UPI003D21C9EC
MIKELLEEFNSIFGKEGVKDAFFSPGRVNLIGEHIDYNGGNVFPCAIDSGTYGIGRKRNDSKCRIFSHNIKNSGIKEFDLKCIDKQNNEGWIAYEKGVAKAFIDNGQKLEKGFDMLIYGNIPNGAGLSSSASVELLMAAMLKEVNNIDIDMIEMVRLSQKAENEYVGVKSGIMDQFAIGMGKKDHAILLNCDTLMYEYAPLILDNASIVITNTNKKRGLADSKYNERRLSCEDALKILQNNGVKINHLCDLSIEEFEKLKSFLINEIQLKRATHAVTENERTKLAVEKLKSGDLIAFGKLMNESHLSLKNDYEVTGLELDTMVELAWDTEGVLGSRMTGAGFGGCTVSIVKNEFIDNFKKYVGEKYYQKIGKKADFYVVKIGDGTRKIGEY